MVFKKASKSASVIAEALGAASGLPTPAAGAGAGAVETG